MKDDDGSGSSGTGRFNSFMNQHFRGCPQVYEFADSCRGRQVRVYDVGHPEVLGVTDDTDAWMIGRGSAIDGVLCSMMTVESFAAGATKRETRSNKSENTALTTTEDSTGSSTPATSRPRIRLRMHLQP